MDFALSEEQLAIRDMATRFVADAIRHVIENPMLNGEVIYLDGALCMAPK